MNDDQQPASHTPPSTPPVQPIISEKDLRTWTMLCHLSALVGLVGIPPFVGPLVVWLVKRDQHPRIDEEGKKSLNFQITVTIAMAICFALMFVCVGFFLAPIVGLAALIFVIIATIKTNNGEVYNYPFSLKLIK